MRGRGPHRGGSTQSQATVTPGAAAGGAAVRRAAPLLIILGLACLALMRVPVRAWTDVLWAEDGAVFLSQAVAMPEWNALVEPYAGYGHLIPRLAAEAVAGWDLHRAPLGFSLVAVVATAGLAWLIYVRSERVLSSRVARFAVSLPVVVLPVGLVDVPANVANLHWPLTYACAWLLFVPPGGTKARTTDTVVLAAGAASDPLVALLLPLALVRAWRAGWAGVEATIGIALGLLFQALVRAFADAEGSRSFDPTLDIGWLALGYLTRVLPSAVLGERLTGEPSRTVAYLVCLGVAGAMALALTVLAFRNRDDGERLWLVTTAVVYSTVWWTSTVGLTGVATPRYLVVPCLLLISAGALLLDGRHKYVGPVPMAKVGVLLLGTALITSFAAGGERASGPYWQERLSVAHARCSVTGADVAVPIAPHGWEVVLPCSSLPLA